MKINADFFPVKAYYCFSALAIGPIVAFMPVIAKQIGFTAVEVGTIFTILPLISIIARPFFGVLADKFLINKFLFILLQAILFVGYCCIAAIPQIKPEAAFKLQCATSSYGEYGFNMLVPIKHDVFNQYEWPTTVCDDENHNWVECFLNCESPYKRFFAKLKLHNVTIDNDSILFHSINYVSYDDKDDYRFNYTCPPQNQTKDNNLITNCKGTCQLDDRHDLLKQYVVEDRNVTHLHQFWILIICLIIARVSLAVVTNLGDTICFQLLGDKHFLYGKQRIWASIGWGSACLYAGYLVDSRSQNAPEKDYSILFYIMMFFIGCSLYFSYKVKYTQQKGSQNILKDVTKLFGSPQIVIFACWCGIVGVFTSLIWSFLYWHLEDLADVTTNKNIKTLQGLASAVQCFGGEIPLFYLSGKILKKIGHVHAMSFVLLGFAVRFTCYSLLTNPWYVLPIELLHGLTFSIFYATMASYANIIAPPGTAATLQGLVGGIFEGIGVSSGAFIGGLLIKNIGGSKMYRYFGIIAFLVLCIHIVLRTFIGTGSTSTQANVDSKTEHVQNDDNEKKDVEMSLLEKPIDIREKS